MTEPNKVKIDKLPFYSETSESGYTAKATDQSVLQDGFKVVREGVNEGISVYNDACESVNHVVETGSAHSSAAYYQLQQEENLPARLAIISGAGLVGLMVGALRGRIVKKVLYSGIGAGAGASFCYPEDAKEITGIVYDEGRRNALVAYNFINGGIVQDDFVCNKYEVCGITSVYLHLKCTELFLYTLPSSSQKQY